MKTLIICETMHNNTPKIARAMADVLKAKVIKSDQLTKKLLDSHTLIGFGSGIYGFMHHKKLLRLAMSLPKLKKKVFIFSTSGMGRIQVFPDIHFMLRNVLKRKGFEIIGEFACKGHDKFLPFKLIGGLNKGHPNKQDIANARLFARNLLKGNKIVKE